MVTEACAKTYQLAKSLQLQQPDINPFDLTILNATETFLKTTFTGECRDIASCAGRLPGSWTLPVCNTSTWGNPWNFDYMHKNYSSEQKVILYGSPIGATPGGHPSCMCGKPNRLLNLMN